MRSWTPAAEPPFDPLNRIARLPKLGEMMSPMPSFTLRCLLAVAPLVGVAGAAHGQALPSTDRALTTRSADNDPDLVVARETYDTGSRTQSLYLRVNDGTPDRQAFSGRLIIRGAEAVRAIYNGAELATSDALWGIAGVEYGGAAPGRGLDGADPGSYTPVPGDPNDAVRIESPRSVRFYFGTDADIDDLRILVRYPAEPGPASFDVQLFYSGDPGRPDPEGWPLTSQGGIQVGSLVDAVPDDGDYSEVFEIRSIKLRIEDLDVVEASVEVGTVTLAGGLAGPATLTVDNFANGTDLDQDNGFDQNGLISPIPAGSDLEHLAFRTHDLVNAATGELIPAAAVQIVDPPVRVGVGEAVPVSVQVQVPGGLSSGAYAGRLEVFEDNSLDGLRNGAEPFDLVNLSVIVGERPEAGFDLGRPDFGLPDVVPLDMGPGPTDALPSTELPDRGPPGDGRVDGQATDAPVSDLGSSPPEAGRGDVGPGDARTDAGPLPDDGAPIRPEAGPRADAERDGGPLADAAIDAPPDARRQSAPVDFGQPRGGAFNCSASPGRPAPVAAPWWLAALLVVARRRRP